MSPFKYNAVTGKLDLVGLTLEEGNQLYVKTDQTSPQEITNGFPHYSAGHAAFPLGTNLVDKDYVDAALTQDTYVIQSRVINTGTEFSGTYVDTHSLDDGTEWVLREQGGANGLSVECSFTGINLDRRFDHLEIHGWYDDGAAEIVVQFWDWAGSSWETYETFTATNHVVFKHITVTDSDAHTNGSGVAKIRFYQTATGATNRYLHLDYVALIKQGIGSSSDHGSLSGLADDDHAQYLKTDGSRTLTGDQSFGNFKAIAMACDNGTTFPATPVTAQWFYRSDIKTLFQYEGGWKSIISFGPVTLYVDAVSGTDSIGKGYTSGAGATQTIQYAINLIPPINGGNVTVSIASGTYENGQFIIQGKGFSGAYTIKVIGEMSEAQSQLTADSATAYSLGVQATLTDTGAFTGDVFAKTILRVTGGTGYIATVGLEWQNDYVIDTHTDDTLSLVGTWWGSTPNNTTTYRIMDFATIIDGNETGTSVQINGISILAGQQAVKFYYLHIKDCQSTGVNVGAYSYADLYTVKISAAPTVAGMLAMAYRGFASCRNINAVVVNAATATRGLYLDYFSQTIFSAIDVAYGLTNSYINATNPLNVNFHSELGYNNNKGNKFVKAGLGGTANVYISFASFAEINNNIIDGGTGTGANPGILISDLSAARIWAGNEIKNHTYDGVRVDGESFANIIGAIKVTNNTGWGLQWLTSSYVKGVSNITFSGNTLGTYQSFIDSSLIQYLSATETLKVNASSATAVPIIAKATASQSANLQEWQKSDGTTYVSISSVGVFFPVQSTTAAAPAYVKGGIYFDTTLNKLRVGGAVAWETITSV